jgi:transposase
MNDLKRKELREMLLPLAPLILQTKIINNRFSDEEMYEVIKVMQEKGMDVSRWSQYIHENEPEFVELAEEAVGDIYEENDSVKVTKLEGFLNGRDLRELSEDEIEFVCAIAEGRDGLESFAPCFQKQVKVKKKKSGRPTNKEKNINWRNHKKARKIVPLLMEGKTIPEIIRRGICSTSYATTIKKRLKAEGVEFHIPVSKRKRIVPLLEEGKSVKEIVELLNVSHNNVYNVMYCMKKGKI